MSLRLASLLDSALLADPRLCISVEGIPDVDVRGICDDSRQVRPGFIFAALRGEHLDGRRFIPQAISSGAAAVIHEGPPPPGCEGAVLLRVDDAPGVLSLLSACFYGHPGRRLGVVGVTGTNGKSTTLWLLVQLLRMLGKRTGYVGSAGASTGGEDEPNPHHQSTPVAYEVHRMLGHMVQESTEIGVVEATSHGLSFRTSRLRHVPFHAAVFTNLTHEHLEFHGTMEQYRSDKANLFRSLLPRLDGAPPLAVLNADDDASAYMREQCPQGTRVLLYSLTDSTADATVVSAHHTTVASKVVLRLGGREVLADLPLPGNHNVQNFMAASLAALAMTGRAPQDLAACAPRLTPVRGRLDRVQMGQPFHVWVDFAHTPDAFERVFSLLRPLVPGKLIVVFGSAGERDSAKRPMQGRVACTWCDLVILTDEDPRGEDRMAILREIAQGCDDTNRRREILLIPDRAKAIRRALEAAAESDGVLLLGKGHEHSIEYADHAMEWDEAAAAREALRDLGYGSACG